MASTHGIGNLLLLEPQSSGTYSALGATHVATDGQPGGSSPSSQNDGSSQDMSPNGALSDTNGGLADPNTSPSPANGTPGSYNGNTGATDQYLNSLPAHSTGWCARSVNNILADYTGVPSTGSAGANAGQMGPILESRYGMTPVSNTGQYQNGDTMILQSATGGYGHIQTYMNGSWYSDFQQKGSLAGSSRYSSSQLYRLPSQS